MDIKSYQVRRLTPYRVTNPTAEPLTLDEVKFQLNIAIGDTSHDTELMDLIQQAREEWERDTDQVMITSTWAVKHESIVDGMRLPSRPIQSITSIQYYDLTNTLQTMPTSLYNFDASKREIHRAYLKIFPVSLFRWDAWLTTYVAGYGPDGNSVPAIDKRAMLLLCGYYFEQRGDNDRLADKRAYEKLVANKMRSVYP